ncbi:Uncharacterized protein BM_BM5928 [Brugia malayi]|uniref:ANK_REP_REGION domain-containing protein n=1 Tax=Brugia malayi TaxID=6279 RepID=A0A4E9FAE5_BRUMA|nr:Uncharacterized protein BM_BM5928 [Brugia malayi]VIO93835.1 Uncharacterized protein BM_BM5928 [Brugia malayi]
MAATKVNGHVKETETSKCNCCPFGFHIDLGFVDFVENVANENSLLTATNDENGPRKNSLKHISDQNDTSERCYLTTKQLIEKSSFSPLDSIFSDSLENVVSDFEETLNLRKSNSKRESRDLLNNALKNVRCNGYFSDYGTTQSKNRLLPPKMSPLISHEIVKRKHISRSQTFINSHNDAASSSGKPVLVPEVQQHEYHTALGRAISKIKSNYQNNEPNDHIQKTLFTTNSSQASDFWNMESRNYNIGLSQEGKMHYLGSRTPDAPRRSLTLASSYQYPSDTESVQQPHWRIRRSLVERSSSAVDVDGFVSMRRHKADDNAFRMGSKQILVPPMPYLRNCSPFSERLIRDRSSPSYLSLNFSIAEKCSIPSSMRDIKESTRTYVKNISNESVENNFVQSANKDALPVGSNDLNNDVNANGICFQCCNLQKQLSDLSCRLKEATDEAKSKIVENQRRKEEERVIVDKSVGDSCEMLYTEKIKEEKKDTGTDALLIEVDDKRTSISSVDRVEMLWYKDIASSPVSEPQFYSTGITTDKLLASSRGSATDLPNQELLVIGPECHFECSAEPLVTNDYGCGSDMFTMMCDFSSMTDAVELVDSETGSKQSIPLFKDSSSMTTPITSHSRHIQTEQIKTRTVCISTSPMCLLNHNIGTVQVTQKDSYTVCGELMTRDFVDAFTGMDIEEIGQRICYTTVASQTEFEQSEPRVIDDREIAESLWLIPSRDRKDVAVGNEDDVIEVHEIPPPAPDGINHQKEMMLDSDDDDMICVIEETLSDPEDIDFKSAKSAEQLSLEQRIADNLDVKTRNEVAAKVKTPRALGHARAAIVKKMLTEKSQPLNFIRGTAISKSWRSASKKGDPLQYIVDQHETQRNSDSSTPQTTKDALKEKVNLKRDFVSPQMELSKVPEPVPARIPRPKISKYIPGETVPQSPDEEAEIADRLTPLRSEMRTLRTYSNGRAVTFPRSAQLLKNVPPKISSPGYEKTNNSIVFEDSTSSSSDSEGSYDTNEASTAAQFELTLQLNEAIGILKNHFQKSDPFESSLLDWATNHAKHEWLKTAARKTASAVEVEGFIDMLEATSDAVLKFVINLADPNGNTALHYAISHGNFDVVSVLLDSRVCNLDRANKAGYTPVMLASLYDASDEVETAIIHRLFQLGDVNAQAVQHGQTALMLAVSHGKINTTKLLIDCQADLNIQDEEGSTALMCAAEHGHKEIVKLLLLQKDIDASLSDCDSSTALSIAVENGHRDIGVLIYAHLNHSCKQNQKQQKIELTS